MRHSMRAATTFRTTGMNRHHVFRRTPGFRPPRRYSDRQRRAVRVGACALRVEQARRVVAAARHSPRAHLAGRPEQNGRHERMHLTLKPEATRPAAHDVVQQQMRFDPFLHRYNQERPHQAFDMATPASRYTASAPRSGSRGTGLPVSRLDRRRDALRPHLLPAAQDPSQSGVCRPEGGKQTADHVWLVSFMGYDLGDFDDETYRLKPIEDPFGPRLSPMSRAPASG